MRFRVAVMAFEPPQCSDFPKGGCLANSSLYYMREMHLALVESEHDKGMNNYLLKRRFVYHALATGKKYFSLDSFISKRERSNHSRGIGGKPEVMHIRQCPGPLA